jgi:multiple sugar transport system permease protein
MALNAIMASKLIPVVAIAIPYYALMQQFALTDNLLSLVLIHSALTLPITVLFLAASIRRIDRTIDEAARLDGLNPVQILCRVILPLARPSLVGAALFAFMLSYSEFLFALLLASNQSVRTLPVTLASVSVNPDVSLGLITAGVVVGIAPTLLLIVPIWKLMISGLVEGATKG